MKYVLICILLQYYGYSTVTYVGDFSSMQACQIAAKKVKEVQQEVSSAKIRLVCAAKE